MKELTRYWRLQNAELVCPAVMSLVEKVRVTFEGSEILKGAKNGIGEDAYQWLLKHLTTAQKYRLWEAFSAMMEFNSGREGDEAKYSPTSLDYLGYSGLLIVRFTLGNSVDGFRVTALGTMEFPR